MEKEGAIRSEEGETAVIEHDKRIRERKYESIPGDWKHGEFELILGYSRHIPSSYEYSLFRVKFQVCKNDTKLVFLSHVR